MIFFKYIIFRNNIIYVFGGGGGGFILWFIVGIKIVLVGVGGEL